MEVFTAITTGIAAFIATNIDDIFILTVFFAQVKASLHHRQIVIGQYLGFIVLLLVSLPGVFGPWFIPLDSLRWLGTIPVILGIAYLCKTEEDTAIEGQPKPSQDNSFLSPQISAVAAVTIANGGDNIGIYVPLFANSAWQSVVAILVSFLLLVGVWCYLAYQLTHFPLLAKYFTDYSTTLIPSVLIGLGVFIFQKSVFLALLVMMASYIWIDSIEE
jgi:cadmium resistance transport/sequestration family protein